MIHTPTYIFDEEIVNIITKGISDGKAQSACIWDIIRIEKWPYPIDGTQETRDEWNTRYHEIDSFLDQKWLRVPEISPLIEWLKRDIMRLLKSA